MSTQLFDLSVLTVQSNNMETITIHCDRCNVAIIRKDFFPKTQTSAMTEWRCPCGASIQIGQTLKDFFKY